MADDFTITTRSEGLLGQIGQWGAALITDEELLEALAAHDAEVRATERERAALHAEEGYRMEERCDDIAKRIRSGEPAEIAARPGVVAEQAEGSLRPAADAGDYPAGTRWMCADSSVWETGWDAAEQQWAWVPMKREGAETDG